MKPSLVIEGIILGLSVAAPIGPTNIEMIRRGLKGGFGSCVLFAAGVDVALITYLAAVFAGFSFLTEVEAFNIALSVFGILVLFYLGYLNVMAFFRRHSLSLDDRGQEDRHFIAGILLTLTNPAVLLFWSGIIGVNLATREFSIQNGVLVSGGIVMGVSVWLLALSALLQRGRKYVTPAVFGYVSAVAGLVLIGFGLSFAYRIALKII